MAGTGRKALTANCELLSYSGSFVLRDVPDGRRDGLAYVTFILGGRDGLTVVLFQKALILLFSSVVLFLSSFVPFPSSLFPFLSSPFPFFSWFVPFPRSLVPKSG